MEELKKKYIGKELSFIIRIKDVPEDLRHRFQKICKPTHWDELDLLSIMVFKDNEYLAFVDFGCDEFRSGDWFLVDLEDWLDTGYTSELKKISGFVKNIEKYNINEKGGILITTDNYLIDMGQDKTYDYYPRNYFSIKEIKDNIEKRIMGRVNEG